MKTNLLLLSEMSIFYSILFHLKNKQTKPTTLSSFLIHQCIMTQGLKNNSIEHLTSMHFVSCPAPLT